MQRIHASGTRVLPAKRWDTGQDVRCATANAHPMPSVCALCQPPGLGPHPGAVGGAVLRLCGG